MEPGESSYSAERRRFPVAFLAGAVVMALLFGGFYLLTRVFGSHGPATAVKLPFGAAEQAYAERIHFSDLHMSRSTNMIKQEFTYVTGIMSNDGDRQYRRHGSHRRISRRPESGNPARFAIRDRASRRPAAQRRPQPRIPSHSRTCSRRVESRVSFHTCHWPKPAIACNSRSTLLDSSGKVIP